jgi:uncharacterized protein YndB with AHSA1/START domain
MRIFFSIAMMVAMTAVTLAQASDGEIIPPANYWPAKAGEFWYGIYDDKGNAQGYAQLVVTERPDGGRHFAWERKLVSDGGRLEEARKLSLDASGKMLDAEFQSGEFRASVTREGKDFTGKSGANKLRFEIKVGAVSTLAFVMATTMPLKAGAGIVCSEYNDTDDFKPIGETRLAVEQSEKLKLPEHETDAWKVVLARADGTRRAIWVSAEREIVQMDWGHGVIMKQHKESTKHLFKPPPPTLEQLEPDDKSRLSFVGDFPGFTLEEMWKSWTTQDGLAAFWAPKADIEGKVDGKYWLLYPNEEGGYHYRMLGKVTHWDEHKKLGFTWHWDFEPESQVLNVEMEFEAVEGGVRLKIKHSKFGDSTEEQDSRKGIHEGWEHFCTRLKRLKR